MDGRPDAATIELLVGAAAVVRRDNKASDAYIGRRFGLKPSVAAIVGETLVEFLLNRANHNQLDLCEVAKIRPGETADLSALKEEICVCEHMDSALGH